MILECQQEDSIDNIDTQITEQVSSQISSPHETSLNQQVKDRFGNFNAQIVPIKAYFMNEIYELKNEVDRLKQKVKDQDDMSDKAKLSLLEYENSFLKEELRNKQLIVEKLLNLKTDKTNVQKPSEKNIKSLWHMDQIKQMKKSLIPITKSHQEHRSENTQIYTTVSIRKELYCARRFYGKIC